MKHWMRYGLGFVTGAFICFVVLLLISLANQNGNDVLAGATYFEQPTEEIDAKSFKVLQVINDNAALVNSKENPKSNFYLGPIYLMVNNSGHFYYDDEIIDVASNEKVVQVGIYRYEAKSGTNKTVPMIGITKK